MKNQMKPFPVHWKVVGFCIAGIVGVVVGVHFSQERAQRPTALTKTVKESRVAAPLGLGVLVEYPPGTARDSSTMYSKVPPGIEVTADQRLLINKDMRNVFDYFLLSDNFTNQSDRMPNLLAYLTEKLPPKAYDDAASIAASYARYLAALADQKAHRQPKPKPTWVQTSADRAERLNSKLMQVSRLRQEMLGVEVSRVWFADEEASMRKFAEGLRQTQPTDPQQ